MADVRSMLRNERVARRTLNHPHLTYSTTGTLVCLVCHIQLKSEALWNKHLESNQHAMRLQRIRDNALGRPPGAPAPSASPDDQTSEPTNGSKKRKADDTNGDTRKKTKSANGVPAGFFDEEALYQDQSSDSEPHKASRVHLRQLSDNLPSANKAESKTQHQNPTPPTTADPATVDEDEWAAFERDVATPPPEPSALTAAATISAAPMSAAELAAQSREQASLQKKSMREIEIEGEKEDAARQMEEELDEMAGFDERVKRLREKREQLRLLNASSRRMNQEESDGGEEGDDEHEDDEDDEDADEFDLWSR